MFFLFCCFWRVPASALEFAGANTGSIPDADPAGRDVTFAVSGIAGALAQVQVSMTATHTFVGDLDVQLISPSGTARRVLFSRTGSAVGGANSDLAGTYRFDDRATGDWWAAASAASTIEPGAYRSTTAGTSTEIRTGGCPSVLTFAFDHLTAAQINGTWTLHVADLATLDTGTVSAATLILLPTGDALFGNGFDLALQGSCVRAQFDYTGSGRSSYVVVRNTGGGTGGAITWFIRDNDGTTTGAERTIELGQSTDYFIGGDFDGDGIWDPAVWSSGTPGHYKVALSTRRQGPLLEFDYGKTGDDPKQAGDYDGDGKADFALYRAGAMSGDPSSTRIRLSATQTDRVLTTGQNGSFAAGGSDIDGDGLADIAMQSNAGGGQGKFDIVSGADGTIVDTFIFGTPTDLIVSGSHSGSPLADITVVRGSGGNFLWNTRDSETAVPQPQVSFGLTATDFTLSGDFDGDGIDDYAVWRPNADPAQTIFTFRPSSDPGNPVSVNFGKNGDYPVENSRSH